MLPRHDYSEFSQPPSQWVGTASARTSFGSTGVGYGHKGADFSPQAARNTRADRIMARLAMLASAAFAVALLLHWLPR